MKTPSKLQTTLQMHVEDKNLKTGLLSYERQYLSPRGVFVIGNKEAHNEGTA